jgi:uncharacterized protein YhhL (DUF1145 family)
MIRFLKYLFLGFWVFFILNLVSPLFGIASTSIFRLGIFILILHVLELGFVYGKLKSIGRGSARDILSVLAFGLLFWRPLLKDRNSTI